MRKLVAMLQTGDEEGRSDTSRQTTDEHNVVTVHSVN